MFLHFFATIKKFKEMFFENCQEYVFGYRGGRKCQQNCSILHNLGDRHIYVFCYIAITQEVKTITISNNTKQATDPINLHTKFYKDELNMFPLKE